jgi:hypothetical protein
MRRSQTNLFLNCCIEYGLENRAMRTEQLSKQRAPSAALKVMAIVLAMASGATAAKASAIDVVPIVYLNFRFADCQPQQRTYDLKKYSTLYYGASIVCQLNVAYITYDQKFRYQGG